MLSFVEGAEARHVLWVHFIDEFLELYWVASSCREVSRIAVGDVFKAVDFSKLPEDRILVLALAFDLENLGQVSLLGDALHHVLDQLRLGKGVLVIHREVVEQFVLGGVSFLHIFEGAESANKIVSAVVGLIGDHLVAVRELLEETHGELESNKIGTAESSGKNWVSHPSFPEHGVACLHFSNHGQALDDSEGSKGAAKKLLDLLHTHYLVDFLSIFVVVAIRSLNLLNGLVADPHGRIGNVSQVPLLLQLLLHLL